MDAMGSEISFLSATLLGALQGATEFLPVSSSGHLVLLAEGLKSDLPGVAFEVMVHMGTLMSILVWFRHDLARMGRNSLLERDLREIGNIAVATVPVAMVGYCLKPQIERAFGDLRAVGFCLVLTGLVLLSTRFVRRKSVREVSIMVALLIGSAQVFALLPGISRSGVTISAALWLGVAREEAGRFSFLIAIPALVGSAILTFPEMVEMTSGALALAPMTAAFLSAFGVGLVALKALMAVVRSGRLSIFSSYCIILGSVVLIFSR